MKPSWDEWALGIATAVSTRADCSRSRVGAVALTPDHTIVATGYNGAPSGHPGCLSGACPRANSDVQPGTSYDTGLGACISIHAEQNLVARASWRDLIDATVYVTREPCGGCWKTILGTPVSRVVWPDGERVL